MLKVSIYVDIAVCKIKEFYECSRACIQNFVRISISGLAGYNLNDIADHSLLCEMSELSMSENVDEVPLLHQAAS